MYDVIKISCATPDDILLFGVDMNNYTIEECREILDCIKKQSPELKIVIVPDDFIREITVINRPFSNTYTYLDNSAQLLTIPCVEGSVNGNIY